MPGWKSVRIRIQNIQWREKKVDNGSNPDPYLLLKNNNSDNGSNPDPDTQWKENVENGSNPDP